MDTLLVIVFVFVIKLLTYFLPAIIILALLVVVGGFLVGTKNFLTGNHKSFFPGAKERYLHDIYKELLERKQKSKRKGIFG